jgi:hypothetical protein
MRLPSPILIGLLLGFVLFLTSCSSSMFEYAKNQCAANSSYVEVSAGRMSIDVAGANDPAGITEENLDCIGSALAMPDDLIARMKDNSTEAARLLNNGWQHDTWSDFNAAWIYDDALLIILTEK